VPIGLSHEIDRMGPDNYWFGARPQIILDRRGPDIDAMIDSQRRQNDTLVLKQ
jgi:hypothetical protein